MIARDGVTVTIVDTAGGETAATTAAIRHADFCLIPTRPSIADIEATALTLRVIRAWHKPFAYVLNQTPIRAAARLAGAEHALGAEAALEAAEIMAQPFIVMRNDYQDALTPASRFANTRRTANRRKKSARSGNGSKTGWAMR